MSMPHKNPFDRTARSHALAAAGQRERWRDRHGSWSGSRSEGRRSGVSRDLADRRDRIVGRRCSRPRRSGAHHAASANSNSSHRCREDRLPCGRTRRNAFVEFSWAGYDGCDPASGRGWARLEPGGALKGRLFIHQSDESAFAAYREAEAQSPGGASTRKPSNFRLQRSRARRACR